MGGTHPQDINPIYLLEIGSDTYGFHAYFSDGTPIPNTNGMGIEETYTWVKATYDRPGITLEDLQQAWDRFHDEDY